MKKEELITGMYMCDEDGNEWIDKKTYNCLYEEYIKLQNKIFKAIEYIENCSGMYRNILGENKEMISSQNVLNILKGVDKE